VDPVRTFSFDRECLGVVRTEPSLASHTRTHPYR
jgi:hypothetical protein